MNQGTVRVYRKLEKIKMHDELIVVDLGELSRSKYGESVAAAVLNECADGLSSRVIVDSRIVSSEFRINKRNPVGTYVIVREDGSVLGATRSIFVSE
jgi:hypothetical protein